MVRNTKLTELLRVLLPLDELSLAEDHVMSDQFPTHVAKNIGGKESCLGLTSFKDLWRRGYYGDEKWETEMVANW